MQLNGRWRGEGGRHICPLKDWIQQMWQYVTKIYPVCFGLREPNRAIVGVENSLAFLKSEGHLRDSLKQWLNLFTRWIIKSWRRYAIPTFNIFWTTGLMDSSRITLEFRKFPAQGIKVFQIYPRFCRTGFCVRYIRIILLDPKGSISI